MKPAQLKERVGSNTDELNIIKNSNLYKIIAFRVILAQVVRTESRHKSHPA